MELIHFHEDDETVDEELWRKFLSSIEESIGVDKFSRWFESLQVSGYARGQKRAHPGAARVTREWLSEHYLPLMVRTRASSLGC